MDQRANWFWLMSSKTPWQEANIQIKQAIGWTNQLYQMASNIAFSMGLALLLWLVPLRYTNPKQQHQTIEKPIGWDASTAMMQTQSLSPFQLTIEQPWTRQQGFRFFYPNVSIYEIYRISVKISVNKKAQDRCFSVLGPVKPHWLTVVSYSIH